ncbi:MAG: hypothetical protein AB8B62_16270 [Roseobacter sp.]
MIPESLGRLAAGFCCILAACAPSGEGIFRDETVPMGASSRFDATSFAGTWQIVEAFTPVSSDEIQILAAGETGDITLLGAAEIRGTYRQGVPGELIPIGGTQDRLIVMWVDEDVETAVIGLVSGRFGALIDRDGNVPRDRAAAAIDVFEFFGWTVSALQGFEK